MKPNPQRRPEVHIVLLAVAETPIGGYKVAYEYANALVELGVPVTVWHSESLRAFQNGRRRLWPAVRSLLAWWFRGQRRRWRQGGVSWFDLDERVTLRATGWFPRIRLGKRDAILATAVQTMPFAARVASTRENTSAALIQHFEAWADTPEAIIEAWSAVDERIVIAPWLAEKCADAGLSSHLLPNALVAESFPLGPPLNERPLRVLSLLSPHGYKRPDVVIDTLSEVRRQRPNIEIYTFGPLAEPFATAPGIHYVADPSPQRLRELYQSSRLYFCGSDEEGWHLPPAEATLSGAAVVSTDIGGVRASMVGDALYAPRGDVVALAAQVLAGLDDVSSAQGRVDHARARLLATTYAGNAEKLRRILGV